MLWLVHEADTLTAICEPIASTTHNSVGLHNLLQE
jgi:hypothetical protein